MEIKKLMKTEVCKIYDNAKQQYRNGRRFQYNDILNEVE